MNILLGIFDALNPLAGLEEDINLLILGFKLVILLFIIQFFRNRFGNSPVVTLLVAVMAYVFLFTDYFFVFGPMMFVYLFIIFGFTSILFDLAIAKPWKSHDFGGGDEGPGTTYKEASQKQQSFKKMRTRY